LNKVSFQTILQVIRFGIIGSIAAIINILIVIFLVENFNINPLAANVLAFLIAFNISYIGHRYWSFADTKLKSKHSISIPRFLLVAIISFILNEGLFYIFLNIWHLNYIIALVLVLIIVPIFTFISSKFWAFS